MDEGSAIKIILNPSNTHTNTHAHAQSAVTAVVSFKGVDSAVVNSMFVVAPIILVSMCSFLINVIL